MGVADPIRNEAFYGGLPWVTDEARERVEGEGRTRHGYAPCVCVSHHPGTGTVGVNTTKANDS